MSEALETVVLEPRGHHDATVIWLHGLGADGHDFEPVVPELGLPDGHGIRFIFPHARLRPITINSGQSMRGWYDITELSKNRVEDKAGIEESSALIAALLGAEESAGIQTGRLLLAGFSQGGAVALHCGLRYSKPLAGIIALSTYLVLAGNLPAEAAAENRNIDIFWGHGTADPLIVLEQGEHSRDTLLENGYKVDWNSYPMAHSVSAAEIADIGEFIRRKLI